MSSQYPMIGADPELFVSRKDDGSLTPIFGLIGGTKEHPTPMFPDHGPKLGGYAFQEDGAALEFNIHPAQSGTRFAQNIQVALNFLNDTLLKPRALKITSAKSITLTSEQLAHPNATRLGCLSDNYAYDQKLVAFARPTIDAEALGPHRYAGGHIHVQYNKDAMPANVAAQYMDLFVGLHSVSRDKQGGRRQFYGLPGLYRDKPYGIEYRTLSNYWLSQDSTYWESLGSAVMYFAQNTYDTQFVEEVYKPLYSTVPWDDVHSAIANEDEKMAAMLLAWLRAKGLMLPYIG